MSVVLASVNRVCKITAMIAVAQGAAPPNPTAIKIATDSVSKKDIYVNIEYSEVIIP